MGQTGKHIDSQSELDFGLGVTLVAYLTTLAHCQLQHCLLNSQNLETKPHKLGVNHGT